jgi:hypothetical protein
MEVRGEQRYQADVETVLKMFGNPEFINAKHTALGARNIEVKRCDLMERKLDLEIQREVPVEAPALLKKFLGDWNLLSQTEHWQGEPGKGYHCKTSIQIKGAPVTITGTMSIRPDGDGTINAVQLNVECKIPLVGGKLADFVGASSKQAMQQEFDYTVQYLAHYS